MAKRRIAGQQDQGPLELTISRDDAKHRIEERIEKGRELRQREVFGQDDYDQLHKDYGKWTAFNAQMLKAIFTTDELEREYNFWGAIAVSARAPSLGNKLADLYKTIEEKNHRLDSIGERLELIPIASDAQLPAGPSRPQGNAAQSKKVFIVHGHDEVAKTNLEVFVRENGLEPIVLHRQADQGQTVIEKFERHSDVGYAFILLTPDEVAYLATDDAKPDEKRSKERRARPNVIFEFGYFVGKLGRSKVCCLYTGGVALPSDVSGMIYKSYIRSIDEVAYSITKDLKAAGYVLS